MLDLTPFFAAFFAAGFITSLLAQRTGKLCPIDSGGEMVTPGFSFFVFWRFLVTFCSKSKPVLLMLLLLLLVQVKSIGVNLVYFIACAKLSSAHITFSARLWIFIV